MLSKACFCHVKSIGCKLWAQLGFKECLALHSQTNALESCQIGEIILSRFLASRGCVYHFIYMLIEAKPPNRLHTISETWLPLYDYSAFQQLQCVLWDGGDLVMSSSTKSQILAPAFGNWWLNRSSAAHLHEGLPCCCEGELTTFVDGNSLPVPALRRCWCFSCQLV